MIDLLRNADILLFCCTVSDEFINAQWVQVNPAKLADVIGTQQVVKIPKDAESPQYLIEVPSDITEVCTDARFPLVPMAS